MVGEEWRPMFGDDRYVVSSMGRLRNAATGRLRKPCVNKNGYVMVVFSMPGGKPVGRYMHELVLSAFVSPRPEGMTCSHINGVRHDNRLENLVYESFEDNIRRKKSHGTENVGEKNGAAKLTLAEVADIRSKKAMGHRAKNLASEFGVSQAQIYRICNGENWRERHKGGDQDIGKARWYVERLIETLRRK